MQVFLFFLLLIAIAAAIAYGITQLIKKRREDFQLVAKQLKLNFFPHGDARLAPMLSNLEFFMYGERCKIQNLISGQVKHQGKSISVAIFDYDYTICLSRRSEFSFNDDSLSISNSNNIETFCQTVLVFYDESLDLPSFSLRAESIFDKVANFAGFEDINFERFPAFSKGYRLTSDRVDDTRNLFQSNLIKFYESNKFCTEASGSYIAIFPFQSGNRNSTVVTNDKTFYESRYLHSSEVKPYFDLGLQLLRILEKNTPAVRT